MNAGDFSQLTDEQLQSLLKHAAAEVLALQDGCNLSGIVFTWANTMHLICELDHRQHQGTEWKNTHPINMLFAAKVAQLTGIEDVQGVNPGPEAYSACKAMAA